MARPLAYDRSMDVGATAAGAGFDILPITARTGRAARVLLAVAALALAVASLSGCTTSKGPPAIDVPSGWPIPSHTATVTSGFGAPRRGYAHQGIDLAAPSGTTVRSTAGGRVTFAGKSGDFGRLVVVDHGGGWETRYAHLKKITVGRGDRIRRGDALGAVGHSGNASGDHLHYEIRYEGRAVDPRSTLSR
jgi:murein DD-endopeptidase MepM/ murein hydrolase activator NlpD